MAKSKMRNSFTKTFSQPNFYKTQQLFQQHKDEVRNSGFSDKTEVNDVRLEGIEKEVYAVVQKESQKSQQIQSDRRHS